MEKDALGGVIVQSVDGMATVHVYGHVELHYGTLQFPLHGCTWIKMATLRAGASFETDGFIVCCSDDGLTITFTPVQGKINVDLPRVDIGHGGGPLTYVRVTRNLDPILVRAAKLMLAFYNYIFEE